MAKYYYQVMAGEPERFDTVDAMLTVEANTPNDAVMRLIREERLPSAGPAFNVLLVTAVHENGIPEKVLVYPLRPVTTVDWSAPTGM